MVATKERQHGERLGRVGKYGMRLLPMAAVYGGNASGKTNLFKAIHFAKNLVVKGIQPDGIIPVAPFRMDAEMMQVPVRFSFQLLIKERVYEFSFAVTRNVVVEEKLVEVLSNTERVLYHRIEGKPNFHSRYATDQFLQFAFKGTRDNQLFLTNTVNQKIEEFRPVYDWFKNTLKMIAPDSRFEHFSWFIDERHPLYGTMNAMLSQLDTGLACLGGEDVPVENLGLPDEVKVKLNEDVPEGATVHLWAEHLKERFVVRREGAELHIKRLVAFHDNEKGERIRFDMRHESDGTQRVIDLIPGFLDLLSDDEPRVYIIDEIDRSLHTLLIRQLLELYRSSCGKDRRKQLMFTTHDVLLMDQRLMRRDEMWVAERDSSGSSKLFSFSEYADIRYDKDIRKSYLQGRMGGIPRIVLHGQPVDERVECSEMK